MSCKHRFSQKCSHQFIRPVGHSTVYGESHHPDPSFAPGSSLFCEMIAEGRDPLVIQWCVFFSAWGINTTYHPTFSCQQEPKKRPDLFLCGVNVWVDIRGQEESGQVGAILESHVPLAWRHRQPVLVLFGPPMVRMPAAQGWVLQCQREDLLATPVHLTECPGCGGFRASGVGSAAMRKERPSYYQSMQARATTPHLLAAYEKANSSSLLMH